MFDLFLIVSSTVIVLLAMLVVRGMRRVKSYTDPEILGARAVFMRYLKTAPLGEDEPLLIKVKYVLRDLPDMEEEIEKLNEKIAGPDTPMKGPWKVQRNAIYERIRRIRGECEQVLDQMLQNP